MGSYGGGGEGGQHINESGMLELPLRADSTRDADEETDRLHASSTVEAREVAPSPPDDGWCSSPAQLALDTLASIAFWVVLFYVPVDVFNYSLLALLVVMVLYRLWRAKRSPSKTAASDGVLGVSKQTEEDLSAKVPYTCGVAIANGRELYLVSTLHISPRAPKDVEAVVSSTSPDVVMIELDEERLDRMRHQEGAKNTVPRQEDLQPIRVYEDGQDVPVTLYAQRALWNAEWAGQEISAEVVFDQEDQHGMVPMKSEDVAGRMLLVHRGGAEGEFAPFSLKAHLAARAGAQAVLVVNQVGELPAQRVGGGSFSNDVRIAFTTCSCGWPPVPVLLLPHEDGERLKVQAARSVESGAARPRASFKVINDTYPRRTLWRRLCQGCALIISGIGVLYGIIQCFAVEVGGEFLAAEVAASAARVPCVCIDVDLNSFWSRLGLALLPSPTNLARALMSWVALPRVLWRLAFPPPGNVDVPGGMVLHVWSFPLRTWVAFICAGFCASFITTNVLKLFTAGAEKAAEGSGAVHVKTQQERDDMQAYIMLAIEMYMMPRIYDAVAASRDEAMYQSIVKTCRNHDARRVVVVVGAGHANGILQRVRSRGL